MTTYSDLTNLVEILKNVYGEGLRNQFNDEKMTYNTFPKSDRKPAGAGYIFGIRYSRNQSTGGRSESGKLPTPLTGKKDQGTILPRYHYGTLRITGPAIERAKGNEAAFVDALADEMDDLYSSLVVDMNRAAHMDGFGKIGVLSAAMTPSTTVPYTGTFDNDLGVRYMQEGMLVDFYDSTGATCSTTCVGQRIKSINPSTKVVTFEASVATYKNDHPDSTIAGYTNDATPIAAGSMAVKMGTREAAWASTDVATDMMGLEAMYDDGTLLATFENIVVATYPKWAANILSNSAVNRELSVDLMLQACDVTRMVSGFSVKRMRMGLGQKRKYVNQLLPDVRFQPTVLKGGYETLTFAAGDGSVELFIDPMTQPNKIYCEPDGIIQKYELTPLGWGNLDGSNMARRAGYDEWDLFLRLYTQLGCEQRNCLTKISDLVEPSLF